MNSLIVTELINKISSIELSPDEMIRNIIIYRDGSVVFMQTNNSMYSYNVTTKKFNEDKYTPIPGSIVVPSTTVKKSKMSLLVLY